MAEYREIFEKVPDGLTLHDAADGSIIDVNERFCEMLGYSRDEMLELGFEDIHVNEPPYTTDRAEEYVRKAATEGPQQFEWLDETKAGEPLPVEVNLRQTIIEDEKRILAVVRDIKDRKRRERALERKNERLEKFASMVSHDLRSPLTVLEGHLELAKEDCDCPHLAPMESKVDRMNELIEELLTMAREDEAEIPRETVQLNQITDACWENVVTSNATLINNADLTVTAAPSQLRQVLENLFRNAVEHGGEDVTVTVGALEDRTGFYVEDDGSGISADDPEIVFEAAYSTSEDGEGLGLNIVKQIVEDHGWEISASNGADGGARFEITGI